jgi:hypothetical protein
MPGDSVAFTDKERGRAREEGNKSDRLKMGDDRIVKESPSRTDGLRQKEPSNSPETTEKTESRSALDAINPFEQGREEDPPSPPTTAKYTVASTANDADRNRDCRTLSERSKIGERIIVKDGEKLAPGQS